MNSLQRFLSMLLGIQTEESIRYPIDEESINKNKIIQAQQKQLKGHEAQLARISAERREKEEEEKQKDYTSQLASKANKRQEELRQKRYKHTFSLRYLFNKMGFEKRPTRFGKEIDLTDKDDTVIFGQLNDMIVTDNGYLMVTDQNKNIIHIAKDFTKLIWKPDGLTNYMKRSRIPLAVDENLNSVPDFEEEEHPDILYDSKEDTYKETEVRKRPVKEMIIQREEIIRDLSNKVERLEKIKIDLEHDLQTKSRSLRLLENRDSLAKTELSSIMEKHMQFENKIGTMSGKIIKLTEMKAHHESLIEKYQTIINNLLKAIELHGDKPVYQRLKAEVQDDLEFFKNILPEQTPIEIEKEVVKPLAQPGHPLGKP